MKKLYFTLLTLALLAVGTGDAAAQLQASTTGKAYVGYAKYDDYIYEYDGLSLDHSAKVGCAILLTRDVLEPYIGGTITGMRVGWDTSESSGKYAGFVRKTFNGEDLSTGTATVSYSYSSSSPGWNNMTMTKYQIPEDVEQLVVGFTTNLTANVCAIPTLYPHDVANSCYLWVEGDVDENGDPAWVDMKDRGILPILLTVQDTEGKFNFVPVIQSLYHDGITQTNEAGGVLVRIKNAGSVNINNVEVTSRQGDETKSQTVSLSSIAPGNTGRVTMVPFFAFHSGDIEFSITKVNNNAVTNPETYTLNAISVPSAVARKHTRRPLVEYYESENNYMSPRYYDDYVGPVLENRREDFTYISQHLDDQFMTGEDDATALALALCDNDSSRVSIPAMSVDRTINTSNISYQINSAWNPMFSVLLEPYASNFLDATLEVPTFLDVNVSGNVAEDGETLSVTVGGDGSDMAACMPEGEKACLTVYLMERDVTSDSQLFWTDKEKEASMGQYTHANVIREILTAPLGDVLEETGKIEGDYTTLLDPTWDKQNLYLVAFVHRDSKHGGKRMIVFNSCEGDITFPSGISSSLVTRHSSTAYDLQGRRVNGQSPKGVYIINGKKIVR
ncbi:MAG: Omp28-related outer membrane protein [Alloprevotella sp.]|nr:Omp28-related outer membrane protein [Alloprevotella sp.]